MAHPPIPQRIPPLTWRQPVVLWTPIALGLALGWPALLLQTETGLMEAALIGGAIVFAASFVSMGISWMLGRAPRTRRDVMQHFLTAGIIVAIASPFVLTSLLDSLAQYHDRATGLRPAAPYALIPLAVLLGLPISFFFGLTFALVALVKQTREDGPRRAKRRERVAAYDVQPFA